MQNRFYLSTISAIALAGMLSGCGGSGGGVTAGKLLGFEKAGPDEFSVVKRAPLTIPPDFGLRPPKPGAPRPQEVSAQSEAKNSLIPRQERRQTAARAESSALSEGRSTGEVALLKESGALGVDPSIRQTINRESVGAVTGKEDGLIDKLLFWQQSDKTETGPKETVIIDAKSEARRLRENEALGKAANSGSTPVIRRKAKKSGLF